MNERDYIIRIRANAKRQRRFGYRLNEDATRTWVPFPDYLLYAKGVKNWRTLEKYQLNEYYLDYELECLKAGMEYEHPKQYGVTVSIMK